MGEQLAWGRRYVMVEPTHFRVEYTINPFMDVADQPGVLAKIAQLFAEHGVSIEIMRQTIHRDADSNVESAELRIVTHRASEAALAATVEAVKGLDVINSVTSVLRVEGV